MEAVEMISRAKVNFFNVVVDCLDKIVILSLGFAWLMVCLHSLLLNLYASFCNELLLPLIKEQE